MKFDKTQIKEILTTLPDSVDIHKRKLVEKLLREWGKIDLEEYKRGETIQRRRERRHKLGLVEKRVAKLILLIEKLDRGAAYAIARRLKHLEAKHDPAVFLSKHEAKQIMGLRIRMMKEFFEAVKTERAYKYLHPKTRLHSRIILDLADIFEFATGQKVQRRNLKAPTYSPTGREYGPFVKFSSVVWSCVFGSLKSFQNAMKLMDKGKNEYPSAIVRNISGRYPEWRVFD